MIYTKKIILKLFIFSLIGFGNTGRTYYESFETTNAKPSIKASVTIMLPQRKVEDSKTIEVTFNKDSAEECIYACTKTALCKSVSYSLPATMCILSYNDISNITAQEINFPADSDFDTYVF
nr:uncharacterized protein LOC124808190 [Hydra vulgaris]